MVYDYSEDQDAPILHSRSVERIMTSSLHGGKLAMVPFKNSHPAKIHIIGSVGSGKTTLAKTLSVRLNK